MADLEKIYADKKAWMYYQWENGAVYVYCRCTECGRFLKRGKVLMNYIGDVKFEGWECKVHGEANPFYDIN